MNVHSKDNFMNPGFYWFTGVIEDIHDPEELGRVRVRCIGYHTEDRGFLPTWKLPWAHVSMPVTSASVSDIGTIHGLERNSWVVGFFRDGPNAQDPLITGSIPSITSQPDYAQGFSDPTGQLPYIDKKDKSDTPLAGTKKYKDAWSYIAKKNSSEKIDLSSSICSVDNYTQNYTPIDQLTNPRYPRNQVTQYRRKLEDDGLLVENKKVTGVHNKRRKKRLTSESLSGAGPAIIAHTHEVDTTTNFERIADIHISGSFREWDHTGDERRRVVQNRISTIGRNEFIQINQDKITEVSRNERKNIEGDYYRTIEGLTRVGWAGDIEEKLGGKLLRLQTGNVRSIQTGNSYKEISGISELSSSNVLKKISGKNIHVFGLLSQETANELYYNSGSRLDKIDSDSVQGIEGDSISNVMGNSKESIYGNKIEAVTLNKEERVSGNVLEEFESNKTEYVWLDLFEEYRGNKTETVFLNLIEEYRGNKTETVFLNLIEEYRGTKTETVLADVLETYNQNHTRIVLENDTSTIGGTSTLTIGEEWNVLAAEDININNSVDNYVIRLNTSLSNLWNGRDVWITGIRFPNDFNDVITNISNIQNDIDNIYNELIDITNGGFLPDADDDDILFYNSTGGAYGTGAWESFGSPDAQNNILGYTGAELAWQTFNDLYPGTDDQDILVWDGTELAWLPLEKGDEDDVLTISGGNVAWVAPSGSSGSALDGYHFYFANGTETFISTATVMASYSGGATWSIEFNVSNNVITGVASNGTSGGGGDRFDNTGAAQTKYYLPVVRGSNVISTGGAYRANVFCYDGDPVAEWVRI